jgi:hypothetical protein
VSKPCCAACAELLTVLSGDGDHSFAVRACDNAVVPTELPSWLPVPLQQEMVTRFKGHLRIALMELLEAHARPWARVSLLQHADHTNKAVSSKMCPSLLPY